MTTRAEKLAVLADDTPCPALGETKVLVAVDAATKREIERAAKREDISVREWWRRAAAAMLSGTAAAARGTP